MMADPLSGFEKASQTKVDLDSIVKGATKSMHLIQSWSTASANAPTLEQIICDVRKHGLIYYNAIDMSIETAEAGYAFSTEAIDLCRELLEPTSDLEELQNFVTSMQDTARKAHEDSKATLGMFDVVRTGLIEITKRIPEEVAKLQALDRSKASSLLARVFDWISNRNIDGEAAVLELQRAANELLAVTTNVHEVADWWSNMDTALAGLLVRSEGMPLGSNGVSKLKVKSIQRSWITVNNDYMQYKREIKGLEAHYPPPSQRRIMGAAE